MALDSTTVWTLVRNDIRLLLRSPRTLIISVGLPLIIWPLMLFLSNMAADRQEERADTTIYRYAVTGDESSQAIAWIDKTRERVEGEKAAREAEDSLEEDPGFQFEEVSDSTILADLETALDEESLDLYLEATTLGELEREKALDVQALVGDSEAEEGTSSEASEPGDLAAGDLAALNFETADLAAADPNTIVLRFFHRGDRDASDQGLRILKTQLLETRSELRSELLESRGFPISPETLLEVNGEDAATGAQASGLQLGRFLTPILLLILLGGGSIVAMDSLAGEKERGTLETLLTTAATRTEIVAGKSLSIFLVAVTIAALQVVALLVFIGFGVIPLPDGFTVPVTAPIALLLLFLFLPVVALLSSVLLLVSGRARTYKEAQIFLFPVFLATAIPALVTVLPAVKLRSILALVPISNISLAVKEILSGTFDWPMIAVAWTVNALVALGLARWSIQALSSERLITSNDVDEADLFGGPRLWSRNAIRWFAVIWAVFMLWSLNVEGTLDFRLILAVNMSLMALPALWAIKRYSLGAKRALALRAPKPIVWLGVLIGAPSGLIVASQVATWASRLMGISDEFLMNFSEGMLPTAGFSVPGLLFFFAVLPGVCEEIAFRGSLLHGVRARFGPVATCLITGLIFGIFHVSLFRIAPTAFLGILFAAVTLLSGSIFPAMLWHFLNNAFGVLTERFGEEMAASLPELSVAATSALGFVGLAVALGLIWLGRKPYRRDQAAVGTGKPNESISQGSIPAT